MIRTPYRVKGTARLGATLPGQAGPFGVRPEPTLEPTASGDDAELPLPEDQY
ncbi:hypothetical protein GCM10010517_78670 [Streptosporangium fragile]|uniref:Uncharacterized protein n=1 Tax=Streptosporangium fragile TaxID=46186 RepID=A0ABN3WEY0_9ACTN